MRQSWPPTANVPDLIVSPCFTVFLASVNLGIRSRWEPVECLGTMAEAESFWQPARRRVDRTVDIDMMGRVLANAFDKEDDRRASAGMYTEYRNRTIYMQKNRS